MVTVQHDPRSSTTYVEPTDTPTTLLRRPLFPAVRWGAIFAGVAAGVSVQLVLTLLGIASGLSTIDITEANTGSAMGTFIWAVISMLIAAFVGGYVAARMSGLKRKIDGVLHGLVSWAVTTLLFAILAASAGSAILGGLFYMVSPSVMQSSSVRNGAAMGGPSVAGFLKGQVERADSGALQTLQQHIQAGRRDEAIQLMVRSMNVDQTRASTIVDQALILAGTPERASPQGRALANRAVETASATAWTMFFAVALALAVGIGGGVLGAAGARRVTWAPGSVASPV